MARAYRAGPPLPGQTRATTGVYCAWYSPSVTVTVCS